MQYLKISLKDRLDLIVREEINQCQGENLEDAVQDLIEKLTERITEVVQDERNFGRIK